MKIFTDSLEKTARDLDIKYNLPRKPNKQHLSSYQVFLEILTDAGKAVFCFVCGCVSAYALAYSFWIYYALDLPRSHWSLNIVLFGGGFIGFVALIALILDIANIKLGYRMEAQEETHGSSRWATPEYLLNKEPKVLFERGKSPEGHVTLALLGNKYEIAPHFSVLNESFLLVGPPGSGKTASILIPFVRQFSKVGCMLISDPKGEIYSFTRRAFDIGMRLDFDKPIYSDFFDLFGACKRNPGRAAKVAAAIVSDPGAASRDPFWENAAIEMLRIIILHLTETVQYPTARVMKDFLAENLQYEMVFNPADGKLYPQLIIKRVMSESPNPDVRSGWNSNFHTLPPKMFESIKSTMITALNIFTDPQVMPAFTPPTRAELDTGRKVIDLSLLRKMGKSAINGKKQGNALYIVIPEGESKRLKKVVAACYQIIIDYLRESGDGHHECPCFNLFEEAGNVPPPELPEIVNVGRGRGMPAGICLQNIGQLRVYGDGMDAAIMEGVATTLILPGVKGKNADYAVALAGRTTVLQKEVTDAVGNNYDSERSSQVGRNLIDADEVRRMPYYSQLLMFFRDFYPIKARFPANGKVTDGRTYEPQQKTQVNLNEVEEREQLLYRFEQPSPLEMQTDALYRYQGIEPPPFKRGENAPLYAEAVPEPIELTAEESKQLGSEEMIGETAEVSPQYGLVKAAPPVSSSPEHFPDAIFGELPSYLPDEKKPNREVETFQIED